MKHIAVIGAGISGMAAAYFLSRRHRVWLFEKGSRLGGHTHTHTVASSRGPLAVDTGFIVFNTRTYPNLIRLFAELGVATQPSDMSFSVSDRRTGFEYSSRGASGFFARRRNWLNPAHYALLAEIARFEREARGVLAQPDAAEIPLGEFLAERRFSAAFRQRYLYPMAASIWSTSLRLIDRFPAVTLLRFFDNHQMLGIFDKPEWRSVSGGSSSYIAPLTRPYRERIVTGAKLRSVARSECGVTLRMQGRPAMQFDDVVFACHGDQVLPLLESPTAAEREVFSAFRSNVNDTVLHTDSRLLPQREAARASWNFHLDAQAARSATLTYHMNRLQSLAVPEDYCVSLNANGAVRPAKVLQRMSYEHPLFTLEAIRAQQRWSEVSGRNRTHYCGAYWRNGFHEDGLRSALRVAETFGIDWTTRPAPEAAACDVGFDPALLLTAGTTPPAEIR